VKLVLIFLACASTARILPARAEGQQEAVLSCGTVIIRAGSVDTPDAPQAESCFINAYALCIDATLNVQSFPGRDVGSSDAFAVVGGDDGCSIVVQHRGYFGPDSNNGNSFTCSSLTQSADGGLLFSGCESLGSIQVPAY
jgi:hypothetical protein